MTEKEARTTTIGKTAGTECDRRTAVMPFGKFKGLTIPLVYERQPSYLTWFHETVDGCEEVKEAIRAMDGIEECLATFRQRRQPSAKPLSPVQQQVERLMERFSAQTIDKTCMDLFRGE